jgi:hypothetical protein
LDDKPEIWVILLMVSSFPTSKSHAIWMDLFNISMTEEIRKIFNEKNKIISDKPY